MNDTTFSRMAEENEICRKIVRELNIYGINDRQKAFICYLLSLELEDLETSRAVVETLTANGVYKMSLLDYAAEIADEEENGKTSQ